MGTRLMILGASPRETNRATDRIFRRRRKAPALDGLSADGSGPIRTRDRPRTHHVETKSGRVVSQKWPRSDGRALPQARRVILISFVVEPDDQLGGVDWIGPFRP